MGATHFKSHIIAQGGISGGGINSNAGIFGTTYYVSLATGSDSYNGKSPTRPFKTIQAAVDAAKDGASDLILVGPGRYPENVLIKGKSRLTIIGSPNACKETSIRASEASTKLPFTPVGQSAVDGCCIAIMSTCVEIANITLDASGDASHNYVGIYLGDGYRINNGYDQDTNGAYIHNNFFKYGTWGLVLDGCSEDHRIENNIIYRQSGGGMHIAPGGKRTVQRVYVVGNVFAADKLECYGVYMYDSDSVRTCYFERNSFVDGIDSKGNALNFTRPMLLQGAGVHTVVGNFFGCKNGPRVDPAGTDFASGNFKKTLQTNGSIQCVTEEY